MLENIPTNRKISLFEGSDLLNEDNIKDNL
jgi:hypothetical protein